MWRLTTGEGSSPWLWSANGFLGRQVWEYDHDAGTPEERAEVERLREDFTKHRFQRKESQDLLLRLQVRTDWHPNHGSDIYALSSSFLVLQRWFRQPHRAHAACRIRY
ncbi:hypothetical protein QYE76_063807 [Lolium multiflorum]|uniref:Cycloartenol synthase n=1 Tax=Lolium multiflorum TaxID=4521 RepID=A0AAD8S854_LOLMU|nr:hypothetical protein QYE76_063807 [Lolium multiflorum]